MDTTEPPRVMGGGLRVRRDARRRGGADMDEMIASISTVEAASVVLRNLAHQAPEVLAALRRKQRLARGSAKREALSGW